MISVLTSFILQLLAGFKQMPLYPSELIQPGHLYPTEELLPISVLQHFVKSQDSHGCPRRQRHRDRLTNVSNNKGSWGQTIICTLMITSYVNSCDFSVYCPVSLLAAIIWLWSTRKLPRMTIKNLLKCVLVLLSWSC